MAEKARKRLWLMYPQRLVRQPIVYELGQRFRLITNIRQASVQDGVGIVSLEVQGKPDEIGRAIAWLEETGIKVQPVELDVRDGRTE